MEFAQRYGNMFQLNLAGTRVVILHGYKVIHEALAKKGKDFAGKPDLFRFRKLTVDYSETSFGNPSPKHKSLMMTHHIKAYGVGMKKVSLTVNQSAHETEEALYRKKGEPINVHP